MIDCYVEMGTITVEGEKVDESILKAFWNEGTKHSKELILNGALGSGIYDKSEYNQFLTKTWDFMVKKFGQKFKHSAALEYISWEDIHADKEEE